MPIFRLKSESIIYDLYLPGTPNGKVVLYVPGLPGHPRKKILGESFAESGFTFFEMRFPGSWESDGVFTMDNCVKSLEEAHAFIRNGSGIELRMGVKKEWMHEKVIFLGSSFGGGVILSGHVKDSLTFVLLAPVTKLQHLQGSLLTLPSGEDDLFSLLSRGYTNVYRGLSMKDWQDFLGGKTLVNPETNTDNLKNKKLLFIQGTADEVIRREHTDEYAKELKDKGADVKTITVSGAGHGEDLEVKIVHSLVKIL